MTTSLLCTPNPTYKRLALPAFTFHSQLTSDCTFSIFSAPKPSPLSSLAPAPSDLHRLFTQVLAPNRQHSMPKRVALASRKSWNDEIRNAVFEKGAKVRGKDSFRFRKDKYGNIIR